VVLSLARIRQLSAHEVGHTLGLSHNFAASTYGGRGSVMDYPAPLVGIRAGGALDFSDAYAVGAGAWDAQAVRYAYTQFAPGSDEKSQLEAILRENRERGYLYLTDPDTRPDGAAHPLAAMWDNGPDPVAALAHEMAVRRLALGRFGAHNVAPGSPLDALASVLTPLYFRHRYALEAAAKSVGGLDYAYVVRDDGSPPARPVSAAKQRAALAAILATLEPAELDLPDSLLGLLPPRAVDYTPRREFMGSATGPAFDALGAAATATDLAVGTLLPPERLARLVDFHRRDAELPGVAEVLAAITRRVFEGPAPNSRRLREVRRAMQAATVRRLIAAAAGPEQVTAVRAALESSLRELASSLDRAASGDREDAALRSLLATDIRRWLARPASSPAATPAAPPALPPGPPIGGWDAADGCDWPGDASRPR
jgi:hypothetical protein